MRLNVFKTWTIEVNSLEYAVINKSLRGTLHEDQKEAAKQLAEDLARQKIALIKHMDDEIKKLESSIAKS